MTSIYPVVHEWVYDADRDDTAAVRRR